jgi:hypothetical protein
MNTSSVPADYSLTSSDTITFSSSATADTITIDNSNMVSIPSTNYYYTSGSSPFTTGSTVSTITIGGVGGISSLNSYAIDASIFQVNVPEEFVECLPDFDRIQKMCKEYPGLQIAFEKFKTTYLLVKNHYDTPEDQRPRP